MAGVELALLVRDPFVQTGVLAVAGAFVSSVLLRHATLHQPIMPA